MRGSMVLLEGGFRLVKNMDDKIQVTTNIYQMQYNCFAKRGITYNVG